jgi:general L-amino acid transport system permease protein
MKIKSSEKISFWYDPDKRAIVYQIEAALLFAFVAWYLISNTMTNLANQNIATGFGFLEKEAAFEIGESLIEYSAADRYLKALSVGFLNTLLVSFVGILLTVVLGTFLGIARLSKNWLVNKCAAAYIELFQDIPVLL